MRRIKARACRIADLEDKLAQTRAHLEAERRAAEDLLFESSNTPDVIASR